MIVIHKKRIQMIICCILIAIFAFSFQMANNPKQTEKDNTVATTATPVSGKTIVIDARSWYSR